jgi:hypothetical protein
VGIANLTNGYHEIAILTGVQFGPNILFNQSTVPVTFSVQNSTLNPSVPELSALVVLPLSLFLLFVAVALMHRKDVNIKK